ncbi:hypothetical protein DPEC_G00060430 [Dallia pectoralis]|uniref:Uncharacterized protein n=1 Tax=Dallia pectoralis TaxID=75939 RepID=A0ACC2H709_DALPE|nr:hypothetical protein DPEC_G00060430 [Dallia pectoralis]
MTSKRRRLDVSALWDMFQPLKMKTRLSMQSALAAEMSTAHFQDASTATRRTDLCPPRSQHATRESAREGSLQVKKQDKHSVSNGWLGLQTLLLANQ